MPSSHHHDLRLLSPAFDAPLVDVVTELEHLRRHRLAGIPLTGRVQKYVQKRLRLEGVDGHGYG